MVEKKVTVINQLGIHARPAGLLVQTASGFESDLRMIKDGAEADLRSVMNIMILCVEKGAEVTIQAEGNDEVEALDKIVSLFANKFGEAS